MHDALDEWFAREILIHEGALVAFLQRAWRDRDEVHDLRQETYIRVYEAARKGIPHAPRAFLFTTARHLITDRIRRSRVVSIETVGDLEALNVLFDEATPERRLDARQVLRRLADALNRLPQRCRQVIWLRRVEELSQREVAARLGISEKTVENQVAKGTRLMADYFHGNVPGPARRGTRAHEDNHASRVEHQQHPD